MLIPILMDDDFESRESVKDYFGFWICEGMYVNEISSTSNLQRQGWVTEVIDEKDGLGKIKVKVVRKAGKFLDEQCSYITEFEKGTNWCKALV